MRYAILMVLAIGCGGEERIPDDWVSRADACAAITGSYCRYEYNCERMPEAQSTLEADVYCRDEVIPQVCAGLTGGHCRILSVSDCQGAVALKSCEDESTPVECEDSALDCDGTRY